MTTAHPSDETLTEFAEGLLDQGARERTVAHLAECEDCFERFAGAAAVDRELEREDRAASLPIHPQPE